MWLKISLNFYNNGVFVIINVCNLWKSCPVFATVSCSVILFMHARKRFRHCITLQKPIDAPHQNIKSFLTQMVALFHHDVFCNKSCPVLLLFLVLFIHARERFRYLYPRDSAANCHITSKCHVILMPDHNQFSIIASVLTCTSSFFSRLSFRKWQVPFILHWCGQFSH